MNLTFKKVHLILFIFSHNDVIRKLFVEIKKYFQLTVANIKFQTKYETIKKIINHIQGMRNLQFESHTL